MALKTFQDVKRDAVGHALACADMQKPNGVCMCLTDDFACTNCGRATQAYLIELKPDTPAKWFGWCYDCRYGRSRA